ncbi:Histidine kinase [Flavobacteriaceae bacterium MAR_2010_188]|nr:Histidine kinase [Flavobacteriaceae bacterium MAR_2010_188]
MVDCNYQLVMKSYNVFSLFVIFVIPFICHSQQSQIDSLKQVISTGNQENDVLKAMNNISMEYVRTDVEQAKFYLWKAKYLGQKTNNQRYLSSTYSQLLSINQNQGQIDSAMIYLKALKDLSDGAVGIDADIVKGNYYSTVGLFYKKSGRVKEALPNFIKSYEISLSRSNLSAASGQAINIGNSYLGLSDFSMALTYYLKALEGFDEIKNQKGQSFCYQNIGECYIEMNRFDSALQYINKSIMLKEELQDKRGLGNAEQSLGRIYMGLKNYDKSLEHYFNALAISRELKLSTDEVKINQHLGKVYAFKNDHDSALNYFVKSKELAKNLGDNASMYSTDLEILALKKANVQESIVQDSMLENIQIFKDMGSVSKEAAAYKNLATYYLGIKQYEKALDYTNRYVALNDSIRNNEIQAKFKTIEENYNKANNEKQIALLQKDKIITSEKIKQQRFWLFLFGIPILFISLGIWMLLYRNKLKQRMKEVQFRNQIAADLHDEVGSSLSSIYLLSKMAGDKTLANREEILKKVSTNAQETMDKMSDIVWMLKPQEHTRLKERMERFLHDLCQARKMSYTFSADDLDTLHLSMQQNKNVFLIFKEAVNNSVKYAEAIALNIIIAVQNKKLHMHIEDKGIGFNESTVLKGNGLDNMKSRANELKGELKIVSGQKIGTTVDLSFPLS